MKGPITQERMEQALGYLSDTDDTCADLGADMERSEWKAKRTKSTIFTLSTGSVAERNALADTSPETEAAYEKYFEAHRKFNAMRNKRDTEKIAFEAWRSLNSNRRQGQ